MSKSKTSPALDSGIIAGSAEKKNQKFGYDKWQLEDALRTCQRYHEILKDKELYAAVKKLAKEKLDELQSLAKP